MAIPTTLQNLFKLAHDYQESRESDPDVLAKILQDFADQLKILGQNSPLFEKRINEILLAKGIILQMRVGQLSFWEQMVKTEDFVRPLLYQSQESQNGLIQELKTLYLKLYDHLAKHRYPPPEKVSLMGQNAPVIAAYIVHIQELVDRIPNDLELNSKWTEIQDCYLSDPAKAAKLLETVNKMVEDSDIEDNNSDDEALDEALTQAQKEQLENAASSLDTAQLRVLLISLPIYDLTSDEKIRILKKAIDQPNLAPLSILMQHDCFNEMTKKGFDDAIAYAEQQGKKDHLSLMVSADGYVRSFFSVKA